MTSWTRRVRYLRAGILIVVIATVAAGTWLAWSHYHRIGIQRAKADAESRRVELLDKLSQRVALDVQDIPLADVLDQLARKFQIPIVFDEAALKRQSLTSRVPVSCHASDVKLRSLLNLLVG